MAEAHVGSVAPCFQVDAGRKGIAAPSCCDATRVFALQVNSDAHNIKIIQGAILVNAAIVLHEHEDVVCIAIDLKSKYPGGITAGGSSDAFPPSVYVESDHNTTNTNVNYPQYQDTQVEFLDYVGWNVFAANIAGRYTCNIVLVKGE